MLYLDIKLEQPQEMFCEEALLATVSFWLKRRYDMIFSRFWSFGLLPAAPNNSSAIFDRIFIEDNDYASLLEQYHGIQLTFMGIEGVEDIIGIAYRELKKGFPIAVNFNNKYYPWTPENTKGESLYYPCLVTGISDDNEGIYCIDIHDFKKPAIIPKDVFIKAYKDCVTFSIVDDEKNDIDWRAVIKSNTSSLLENNSFESIREFSKLIANPDNYALEISGNGNLGEKIKYTYHSRYFFSHFFTYLINYHNAHVLSECRDRFIFLSNQWLSLWGLVTATVYRQKLNGAMDVTSQGSFIRKLETASAKLCNIADIEQSLCDDLIKIIEGRSVSSQVADSSANITAQTDGLQEYRFVDISGFLNNEGFYSDIGEYTEASLTSTGQVFLTHGLPSDDIWNFQGMRFKFPQPVDNKTDNISCAGQKINLENGCFSCIMLMGCAEWGHYSELLEIRYLDGTVSHVPLEFTDWTYPESHFGEIVVWEGMCAEKDRDGVLRSSMLKGHLYARALNLNPIRQLDYIRLPDCSNIHLFAITLAK
ncbi:hypothetical protein DFR58_105179 [Anaerobacterium chartisolvens]|uniref:Butirosin biosynthesis protein H-like n=1 Tax=Anaerobacterium chartisolvens TaxID=1297424 RepID=A0A369BAR6_9FIRM|nr:hypothetical protein [Anaerobacterium chartisolvens]RCX18415.1 hypothetical protein DFR58_105179 [Anaerobacterium chartisolvens]